jgi:eukaryotic-like serine/threonine-protein kinase
VKPSNVIADAGVAKLIDLSIARRPGRVKAGLGTWSNLAPEQARGGDAGPPADVWGLGTVLYEALTGTPPFDDRDGSAHPCLVRRADRVRRHRPRAPRALASAIDAALEPRAGRPAGARRAARRARRTRRPPGRSGPLVVHRWLNTR